MTFVQPPFWAPPGSGRAGQGHVGVQFVDTLPIVEPLTVDEAKAYLRVEIPDDDALIARFITAARVFCEHRTQRAIAPHVADVIYDRIAAFSWITLPFAPVQAVQHVQVTDINGVQTPVDPTLYLVDLVSEPPRLGLTTMGYWPFPMQAFQAVTIRLTLGYATVPEDLVQAMRLLVAHYYENRNPIQTGLRYTTELPLGITEHLAPFELVVVP